MVRPQNERQTGKGTDFQQSFGSSKGDMQVNAFGLNLLVTMACNVMCYVQCVIFEVTQM